MVTNYEKITTKA
jgi:hypothetical protein